QLLCVLDGQQLAAALPHVHTIAGAQLRRRDVERPAVHLEMAMADQLARLAPRRGKAEPVHDVVEPALELLQQHGAGDPLAALRALEVVAELRLEHAVQPARPLLGTQLDAVVARLAAAGQPVLPGEDPAALVEGAVGDALRALEKELHALAPAQAAHRPALVGHYTRLRLGGRHPLCGMGVMSEIAVTSRPLACRLRMAASRPAPGPLTKISTERRPCSIALRAAPSAVTCAAKGVLLREPLKPCEPAEPQAITLPSGSVRLTIVLLKVASTCACPTAMFLRSRRRVRTAFFFLAIYLVTFLRRTPTVFLGPLRVRALVRVR